MATLVSIVPSPLQSKKLRALWSNNTHTDFGASGYSDYTLHHEKKRRDMYRTRHNKDHINNPYKAGSLSWHILWGESTSTSVNVKNFKRLFHV